MKIVHYAGVEQLYTHAQRFAEACEVSEDSKAFKDGVVEMMSRCKKLIHEGIKLITFADQSGLAGRPNF